MTSSAKSAVVHARLDHETHEMLAALRVRHGARDSAIIRDAIRALYAATHSTRRSKIVGVGEFTARETDLATNPKRLRAFGSERRTRQSERLVRTTSRR